MLIRAGGEALARLSPDPELPARLHTAGDEFAVLLPGASAKQAERRAREIVAALDALDIPATHRSVYHGASVGYATSHDGETPDDTLTRAINTMRTHKRARAAARGLSNR